MTENDNLTYDVPRFLSFIELAYLFEAAKLADTELAKKITDTDLVDKRDLIGNINATRQSLLRSVFISSYAVLEQYFDEITHMERERQKIMLAPSDLKDHGITRSLKYSKKVLGKELNENTSHWKELKFLQEVRNHLVHYGSGFDDSTEHEKRYMKFKNSDYVTLRPSICFSLEQIAKIFELYQICIDDFNK